MARYDSTQARVQVLTFKEGMLSAIGHDLLLEAKRFVLEGDDAQVSLSVEANSVEVITAMRSGQPITDGLPSFAFSEIKKNVDGEVLHSARFPSIQFRSTSITATRVEGTLTLHGVTRPVSGVRTSTALLEQVEVRLDQRDFGIKPYSGLMGTLKVKPEVVVRVIAPRATAT